MGERGPLPKNVTPIRAGAGLVGGEESGRVAVSTVQARVVKAAPNPPTWLDREAAAEWRRVVPELERLGVLAMLDRAVLATYCDAWSKLVVLARQVRPKRGMVENAVASGSQGQLVKNPKWQLYLDASKLVQGLWKDLLLTPNARLRAALPDVEGGAHGEDLLD